MDSAVLASRTPVKVRDFLSNAPNRYASVWSQSLGGTGSAVSRVSPTATAYPHQKADSVYILSAQQEEQKGSKEY